MRYASFMEQESTMIKEAVREKIEPKMTILLQEVRESYGADKCAYPYVPMIREGYLDGPKILICGKGAGSWGLQYAQIEGIGPWSTLADVPEESWYPKVREVHEAFIENGAKRYLAGEKGGYSRGAWWRYLYMVMVHVLLGRKIGDRWNRSLADSKEAELFVSNVAFTNLDKVARLKNNLDADLRRIHARYYTLVEELEVLRPRLVWFPTGPSYDKHLCRALPGFETEDLAHAGMARVHGVGDLLAPGGVALRTFHPQWTKGFSAKAVATYLKDYL
jgi:hypothetical protein